jgi:hypothetical protein
VTNSFHDRVLAMAERLVREHPSGRTILALVLDEAADGPLERGWEQVRSPTEPAELAHP